MPLICFRKGDGFCEPISPLILCQIKQISVKSFYCLRGDPVHSAGRQYYLFFIQKSRFSAYYTFPHSSRLYPLWVNTLKSEKDIFSDLRKHLTRWCILHVRSTQMCSIFHLWCDVCQEAGAQGLGDSRRLMKDTRPHVHLTGRPTCLKAGAVVLLWAQTTLPGRTWCLCQPKARSHPATSGAVPAIAHPLTRAALVGQNTLLHIFHSVTLQAMKRGLLSKPVLRRGKWVSHFRSCFKMPAGRWRKEAQMEMPAAEDTDASRSASKEWRALAKARRGAKGSTNKGGSAKTTSSHTRVVSHRKQLICPNLLLPVNLSYSERGYTVTRHLCLLPTPGFSVSWPCSAVLSSSEHDNTQNFNAETQW